jgi:threonine synthase
MCASTGNTSASAAAYGAKAGIKTVVLIPKNFIAMGKLAQALVHNAKVIAIDGNFDQCLEIVKQAASKHRIMLVNSINPYRLQGQKTGAFEVCEQMGSAPDYHIIPVGNAGNITAYWMGYKEYYETGKVKRLPKMIGFQAEGAAPIVRGLPVKQPKTVATAIRIGNPANWKSAIQARDESYGLVDMVSDDQIIEAYKLLAAKEGIFAEPASAASIAGLIKLSKKDYIEKDSKIVCVLTGNGLKDPQCAIDSVKPPVVLSPILKEVEREIGL